MRLEQLHYFMTVCDKRSINLASKELFITQQSLSSSINNLEKEVGQKLLVRTNRGVYPTELGKRVYAFSRRTLNEWHEILYDSSDRIYTDFYGQLDTLCTYNFLKTFMPKYSVHILEHFPNIHGSGTANTLEHILTCLHRRSIDFAFVTLACDGSTTTLSPSDEFVFIPLFSCELFALVGNQSALSQKPYLTIEDILSQQIVLNQESDMHLYRTIFKSRYKEFLQKARLFHLNEVVFEYVRQENRLTLDLKMGPHGLTFQSLLHDNNVTHIPISFTDQKVEIYGGVLTYCNNEKWPLIENILSTL